MAVEFDHSVNRHSVDGARAALPAIFPDGPPGSVLDVGCGTGTWLKAALEFGVRAVLGIDGAEIPPEALHVPPSLIMTRDLSEPWDLPRRFDAALCLEVAEHLAPEHDRLLIENLARHAPLIIFSAACPGQEGQHHIHCQWPAYWQAIFNALGFRCDDSLRPRIWNDARIEPWYRQNIFVAKREPESAGKEPRILPLVHPEIFATTLDYVRAASVTAGIDEGFARARAGRLSVGWYVGTNWRAAKEKLRRSLRSFRDER